MPEGPLRVLIVVSNLEFGGAQRQIVELVNGMDPAKCVIHVCSMSDYVPLAESLRDRSRLHILPKRSKFDLAVVFKLARLARELRVDVIHGYLLDAEIATNLAGKLAGVRAVIGSERNTEYELNRVHKLAFALTRPCVDMIIANSSSGAAFNARMRGHPASKYRVIRNGVDLTRFQPVDGSGIRAELGFDADILMVGLFASLKQQKNHPLLLRAAARVVGDFPNVRFVFVGDILANAADGSDVYARDVQQQVVDLGLTPFCRFLGNRKDLPALYSACDFTVLPSLFEGTPNVLLESMACGTPVIATDVADNRIVAPDGVVGRIVPTEDEVALAKALAELLGDRELRDRFGLQARAWAEQEFATAVLAERTLAAYRDALK